MRAGRHGGTDRSRPQARSATTRRAGTWSSRRRSERLPAMHRGEPGAVRRCPSASGLPLPACRRTRSLPIRRVAVRGRLAPRDQGAHPGRPTVSRERDPDSRSLGRRLPVAVPGASDRARIVGVGHARERAAADAARVRRTGVGVGVGAGLHGHCLRRRGPFGCIGARLGPRPCGGDRIQTAGALVFGPCHSAILSTSSAIGGFRRRWPRFGTRLPLRRTGLAGGPR